MGAFYFGEHGYFGLHKLKAYGFMLVGMAAGRTTTNSGTLKGDTNGAVNGLDDEFRQSIEERDDLIKINYPYTVTVKNIVNHGNDTKEIVINVKDKIFKVTPGDKC
jgi:hypothetical protein